MFYTKKPKSVSNALLLKGLACLQGPISQSLKSISSRRSKFQVQVCFLVCFLLFRHHLQVEGHTPPSAAGQFKGQVDSESSDEGLGGSLVLKLHTSHHRGRQVSLMIVVQLFNKTSRLSFHQLCSLHPAQCEGEGHSQRTRDLGLKVMAHCFASSVISS